MEQTDLHVVQQQRMKRSKNVCSICPLRRPHYCDRNTCWKKKTVLPEMNCFGAKPPEERICSGKQKQQDQWNHCPNATPQGTLPKSSRCHHLLFTYKKPTDQIVALKAELQYHKIVLSNKSPLLRVGGKVQELVARLKSFLADRAVSTPPEAAVNIPAAADAAASASLPVLNPAGCGRKQFLQCAASPAGQARKCQWLPSPSSPEAAQEHHQSPSPPQPSSFDSSSFKKYSFSTQSVCCSTLQQWLLHWRSCCSVIRRRSCQFYGMVHH